MQRRGPLKDQHDPMRHLRFPVAATRAGMVAEQVVRAFWPFWTAVFLILTPLMMGWQMASRRTTRRQRGRQA